jgi:hypothetical protein
MSRNRVIYQSEALFSSKDVNSTSRADHSQLRRVQSANYSFNVSRTDVNQFGQLSRIDSLILEAPTVSADISYYLADGYNEQVLKFSNSNLNVGFVSGQIESTSGQNLYIMTAAEGKDANFGTGTFGAIGIGNAYITDYSFEASVGSFPTVNISFEGSNINASAGVTGTSDGFSGNFTGAGILPVSGTPIDNQIAGDGIEIRPTNAETDEGSISALRPSDITFDLANANGDTIATIDGNDGAHIQSVSLSIPLSRTPIERLGTRFPYARTVDFPITPSLSVSAIVNETAQRSLTNIVADDGFIPSAQITIKDVNGNNAAIYKLTNLKLDSESFSSSIGPNKTVDLTFSLSIGGPDDLENNVFFSGANTDAEFALQPVVFYGDNLLAGETVTINGVEVTSGDIAGKTVGYLHGDESKPFTVNYQGNDNLAVTLAGGGTISGNAGLNSITGVEGVNTTFTFEPTDNAVSATISGTLGLESA